MRSPADYYTPQPVQPPYGPLAPALPLLLVALAFFLRRSRRRSNPPEFLP